MQTTYSLTERTAADAVKVWQGRIKTQAPKCPLRFRPVIAVGPNDGYIVVELGFAESNGLSTVCVRDLMNEVEA